MSKNDLVVINVRGILTKEKEEKILMDIRKYFPENEILILDERTKIQVIPR